MPNESPAPGSPTLTRRGFLTATALVAAGAVGGRALEFLLATASPPAAAPSPSRIAVALASPAPSARPGGPAPGASGSAMPSLAPGQGRWHYRSRPDLTPPIVEAAVQDAAAQPGLIFYTPGNGAGVDGPTIIDAAGDLVWTKPGTGKAATNFSVQRLNGKPVLTWWEGTVNGGNGDGDYVIADRTYREIQRVHAGNGDRADLHEFLLTADGTALFLAGNWNAGNTAAGRTGLPWSVLDDVVQEVDLRTGRVLFEWHTAANIDVDESVVDPPTGANELYDYVHANSIDVDLDGNLLVSARNTSAVYKVSRTTGRVLWRLGGRKSDFVMGEGATFGYQHDARRHADGSVTMFDDESSPGTSRAIRLRVDETARTATLVQAFARPDALLSTSQGNMQLLSNGNAFVGWGSQPFFTEFAPDGTVVFDASFVAGGQSYRSFRSSWVGQPADQPAVAGARAGSSTDVFASWNGATDVAAWQILGGPSAGALSILRTAPRLAFETAIRVSGQPAFVAARALDASGEELGLSLPVAVG